MRALGIGPVHDTRETFRALCDATSRPGTIQQVPGERAAHSVVATLVDHEVTASIEDDRLREELATQGRYEHAPSEEAAIVHTNGPPDWEVTALERGSLPEPSEGATAIYEIDHLSAGPHEGATTVRVSGPGVDGTRRFAVGLPADELDAIATAQSTYPRGIDVYVTAGDRLVGLPRSVELEVV